VRRGASWTAAYHRQLSVAAVARPVGGSVGALGVLAAARSVLVVARPDGVRPEERPAALERSGVVAVVDPASSHARRRSPVSTHAVSTHPVSASGIRLSSRPLSGHLGSSSSGSGARPSAVHPSTSAVHPVRCPAVWCLPLSVRTRPSPPMLRRWRWGPGRAGRATLTTRTGGGPGGCRAVDGSSNGRGGREPGDAADVALVRGRWLADPGAGVGAGRGGRACPLSDQAGQADARSAPRRRVRGGHEGQAAARGGGSGRVAGVLGWGRDHGGWSSPSLTAGWADPEGSLEVPAGMGVRPQRGPSRERALPALCRQHWDLRRWVVGLPGLEPGTSSLSGTFAGCVHAGRARHGQLSRRMAVTVAARSVP
jgi:hypothetical protein